MNSNDTSDFFSLLPDVNKRTMEGEQLITAGICTLSDILGAPLNQLFQNAIMEHYRACRLNHTVCSHLVELLNNKGVNVLFDTSVEPDIKFVPKVFSDVANENKDIAAAFYRLLMELRRIPSIEELAYETRIPIEILQSNSDIKKLSLEHQQVLNYIEWFCCTNTRDLSKNSSNSASLSNHSSKSINWSQYPYNLFLDVVPTAVQIKDALLDRPELFARLMQRLEVLVYFDLTTEDRNIIISQYVNENLYFCEPALQWGLEFWGLRKKHNTLCNLRRKFQGGKFLAEKGLLGNREIREFSIEELDLSNVSYNRLKHAYLYTISELISKTKDELLMTGKLRKPILEEIVDKVHRFGLCFADEESL